LRKAPQRLDDLRTPEDLPLPPNTVDELRRDMARALCASLVASLKVLMAHRRSRLTSERTPPSAGRRDA
jgi:transposase